VQVWYDGFEKHGWDGGNYMVGEKNWGLIARRAKGGLWRVTYGENESGLSDEDYEARRPAAFERLLPGHPKPGEYRITQTDHFRIHNRCVEKMRVGRIFLAADAAHVVNPFGGYGAMTAILDVSGLADCLIGVYDGRAGEEILDLYAQIRREKFLKYVDARSMKNMDRIINSDPTTNLEGDKLMGIFRELQGDAEATKAFLLVSQILGTRSLPGANDYVENIKHRVRLHAALSLMAVRRSVSSGEFCRAVITVEGYLRGPIYFILSRSSGFKADIRKMRESIASGWQWKLGTSCCKRAFIVPFGRIEDLRKTTVALRSSGLSSPNEGPSF
jgi:FAD binding domain